MRSFPSSSRSVRLKKNFKQRFLFESKLFDKRLKTSGFSNPAQIKISPNVNSFLCYYLNSNFEVTFSYGFSYLFRHESSYILWKSSSRCPMDSFKTTFFLILFSENFIMNFFKKCFYFISRIKSIKRLRIQSFYFHFVKINDRSCQILSRGFYNLASAKNIPSQSDYRYQYLY